MLTHGRRITAEDHHTHTHTQSQISTLDKEVIIFEAVNLCIRGFSTVGHNYVGDLRFSKKGGGRGL